MRKILGNLRMDLKRAFCSYRFLGGVIGVTFILFLNCLNFLHHRSVIDIISVYTMGEAPFFSDAILILAALPYSISFCIDWDNRYIRSVVLRSSRTTYAISKVITCALSSVALLVLGRLLLVFLWLPFCKPVNPVTNSMVQKAINYPEGLNQLLFNGQYWAWILIRAIRTALGGSIFAVAALMVSTWMTNIFITLATPVFAYYLINAIVSMCGGLPPWLSMNIIFENSENVVGNAATTLLYAIIFTTVTCGLMGWLFVRGVRRKLENG